MTTTAKLAVLAVVDTVIAKHTGDDPRTHLEGCYVWHAGCLAVLVRNILEGES